MRRRHSQDLEASLDNYAASVEATTASTAWSERLTSWPVYAAAAGSALALGTSAAASIIYSGPGLGFTISVPGNVSYTGDGTFFSISGFGFGAFPFAAAHHSYQAPNFRFGMAALGGCSCNTQFFAFDNPSLPIFTYYSQTFDYFALKRFASSQMISDGVLTEQGLGLRTSGFIAAACNMVECPGTVGTFDYKPWAESSTGFAGFKTLAEGRFGWVRVYWNGVDGFPNSITVVDWAIESEPGVAIHAGDTGAAAIPEPGTLSMALLAAGAAGIRAWRKWKNTAAPKQEA